MTNDNDKKAAEEWSFKHMIDCMEELKSSEYADWGDEDLEGLCKKAFLAGCEHKQKELDKATELLSLVHVCLIEGRYETLMKAFNIPTPLKPIKHLWFSEKKSQEIRKTLKKEQES